MKTDSPALHRSAVTELIAAGRHLVNQMGARRRANLTDALQLGAICWKLKYQGEAGGYHAALEKMGVDRSSAADYLRLHEGHTTGTDISSCASIQSALDRIKAAEQPAPDPEDAPTPAQVRDEIKARQRKAAEKAQQDSGEKDDFGNPIPKRCLDAWKDPGVREAREHLAVIDDVLRRLRLADMVGKRASAYPFIDAKKFQDGIGQTMNTLEECLDHLRQGIPAGVCPSCHGKGCVNCLTSGLVPRAEYEALSNGKGPA